MHDPFAHIANLLAQGEAPQWLVERLSRFAPLVGHRDKLTKDQQTSEVINAISLIEGELQVYAMIEERFPFVDIPDCIDAASNALHEFREFLQSELPPVRKGGPTPDGRRRLCAGVCAQAWRDIHGEVQPYSGKLQEACEAYWQACGQPETSTTARIRNWEPFLLSVAATP